ncbi:hypothetical protein ACWEQL_03275 [Kitasatospora sp. NPDC004240]
MNRIAARLTALLVPTTEAQAGCAYQEYWTSDCYCDNMFRKYCKKMYVAANCTAHSLGYKFYGACS